MGTIFVFGTYQIICVLLNLGSELFRLAMESRYLNIFCAFFFFFFFFFCHRKGHVINRILHS